MRQNLETKTFNCTGSVHPHDRVLATKNDDFNERLQNGSCTWSQMYKEIGERRETLLYNHIHS